MDIDKQQEYRELVDKLSREEEEEEEDLFGYSEDDVDKLMAIFGMKK